MSVVATPPISPYKGLAPFEDTELDALLFVGRDREQEIVASNLIASRLTVLYGPSGVGKTSVLRAGVAFRLRALAERAIDEHGHPDLAVVVFDDWRGDAVGALRRAIEHELVRRFGRYVVPEVDADSGLAEAAAAWTSALDCQLLLVLDQLEEYFVYHQEDQADDPFAEQLAELVTAVGLRVNVMLSLREDALAKLDRFKARIPNLLSNYLRLDRLPPAAARVAVTRPLEYYNRVVGADPPVVVEPALVDQVVAETQVGRVQLGESRREATGDARRDGVEPAYLQLVLARVWEEEWRRGSSVLRASTLAELGGAEAVVRNHVRHALEAFGESERDVAATIVNYLVTPSGTKIAHSLSDLEKYAGAPPEDVDSVVRALAHERVLRPVAAPGEGNGHASGYEIYHDVLADPLLAWRQQHEQERTLAHEKRRAARRQRVLGVVAASALSVTVLMAAITVYAFSQRSEAREQAALASLKANEAFDQKRAADDARADAVRERETADLQRSVAEREREKAKQAERAAIGAKNVAEDAEARALREAEAKTDALALARRKQIEAEQSADRERDALGDAADNLAIAQRNAKRARRNLELANRRLRETRRARAQATRRANEATARAHVADAALLLASDPERSLSLALKAADAERSERIEDVVRAGIRAVRARRVLLGGGGAVRSVAVSPDGTRVATAALGGEVRLFTLGSSRPPVVLEHPAPVVAVAFSPDGRMVATGARDGAARLWTVTGSSLHRLAHDQPVVTSVAFSPDGRLLVSGSNDNSARVWDVTTGFRAALLPTGGDVSSVSFSPDGERVLAVSQAGARVFRASGGPRQFLLEHGRVTFAAFSPDGSTIVTTSRGGTARLWDARSGERRLTVGGHDGHVLHAAFDAGGDRFATVSTDGTARVWKAASGALEAVLVGHRLDVYRVAFGSATVVTASQDGTARVWAINGNRHVALLGHRDDVRGLALPRGGDTVVTASEDGTARVWDGRLDERPTPLGKHDAVATTVAFTRDGRRVLSAGGTTAALRPIGGGRTLEVEHRGLVETATLSRDSRLALTGSADGTAVIWRTSDGGRVHTLEHGAAVTEAAFSDDGRRVVTAGADGRAVLWQVSSGRRLRALGPHPRGVTAASFSPDGTLVLTAAGTDAWLWRVGDGRRLHRLARHGGSVLVARFSPRGDRVVTAGADSVAVLWDVASGRVHRVLVGHTGAVNSATFSADGGRLVTASEDEDAFAWRVRDGKRLARFRGHSGPLRDARFSPDGRWVVTAGPIAAGLWKARTGELLFFVREFAATGHAVAFSPRGDRIATASGNARLGEVTTYACRLCGRLPELVPIARSRLRALKPLGPAR